MDIVPPRLYVYVFVTQVMAIREVFSCECTRVPATDSRKEIVLTFFFFNNMHSSIIYFFLFARHTVLLDGTQTIFCCHAFRLECGSFCFCDYLSLLKDMCTCELQRRVHVVA